MNTRNTALVVAALLAQSASASLTMRQWNIAGPVQISTTAKKNGEYSEVCAHLKSVDSEVSVAFNDKACAQDTKWENKWFIQYPEYHSSKEGFETRFTLVNAKAVMQYQSDFLENSSLSSDLHYQLYMPESRKPEQVSLNDKGSDFNIAHMNGATLMNHLEKGDSVQTKLELYDDINIVLNWPNEPYTSTTFATSAKKNNGKKHNQVMNIKALDNFAIHDHVTPLTHGKVCTYNDPCNGNNINIEPYQFFQDSCSNLYKYEGLSCDEPTKYCVYFDACNGQPLDIKVGFTYTDSCGLKYNVKEDCHQDQVE